MYEGLVLVALAAFVILAIRPVVNQDSPFVIHKPGIYHATLAPQLARVQDLIERITGHFSAAGDIASLQFKMDDSGRQYLLAAGFRAGMLYFQAIPYKDNSDYATLRQFSNEVLINIPLGVVESDRAALRAAVEIAAMRLRIECLSIKDERDAP